MLSERVKEGGEPDASRRREHGQPFRLTGEGVHKPHRTSWHSGLQRSTRHKSGVAMRFPRISRLRWDKPPGKADRIETLQRMLE
jgi:ATP-dependent DNA ligase